MALQDMRGSFYSCLLLLLVTISVCCQHYSLREYGAKRRVFSHKNIIIVKNNSTSRRVVVAQAILASRYVPGAVLVRCWQL